MKNKSTFGERFIYFAGEKPRDVAAAAAEKIKDREAQVSVEVAEGLDVKDITGKAIEDIDGLVSEYITKIQEIEAEGGKDREYIAKIQNVAFEAKEAIRNNEAEYQKMADFIKKETETKINLGKVSELLKTGLGDMNNAQVLGTCLVTIKDLDEMNKGFDGFDFTNDAQGLINRKENILEEIDTLKASFTARAEKEKTAIKSMLTEKNDLIEEIDGQVNPEGKAKKTIPRLARIRVLRDYYNNLLNAEAVLKMESESTLLKNVTAKIDKLKPILDTAENDFKAQDHELNKLWEEQKRRAKELFKLIETTKDGTSEEISEAEAALEAHNKILQKKMEAVDAKKGPTAGGVSAAPGGAPAVKEAAVEAGAGQMEVIINPEKALEIARKLYKKSPDGELSEDILKEPESRRLINYIKQLKDKILEFKPADSDEVVRVELKEDKIVFVKTDKKGPIENREDIYT